ncbi:MAG TPA: Mur ligase family protein [Chitinophagales bacterium]|nr:Mur ligase family protein [Chitinophagales bacterium]HNF70462.1 Mur ligase family protein [Chitinophagales bacterium]HNI53718.1 Mur ligase family protein [Chitinophagales bacterium]HNK97075.1 Mur ligase family protein [Chitinophagales bacterium]HNM08571.1 Mur ligase family protein [Chitinophagales bacterium]
MRIHLIAIGGAVMHNMALALHAVGHQVSGSDDEIFEPSKSRLSRKGLLPEAFGWFPERITSELDAVILGMHARADNPELLRAQELGIRVYNFPEYVYEQSKNSLRVAICGSHGKTSITSMIMHVLKKRQMPFDFLVGAQLEGFDTMVQFSQAPVTIIEGDEYFASPLDKRPKFLFYHAQVKVISGIAWDHFNVFPTFDNYVDQFRQLVNQSTENDILIANADDDEVITLLDISRPKGKIIKYGAPAYKVIEGSFTLDVDGAHYQFAIFGRHNMQNMEAAKNVCISLGISAHEFYEAMQSFTGAAKRLEVLKRSSDHIIFRDFAHAPSKVKATVDAVREQFPDQPLVACLELHTFSSLNKDFIAHYHGTMQAADKRIVYFNPHTLTLKKLPMLSIEEVRSFFGDKELIVLNDSSSLKSELQSLNSVNNNILLMSSGNYDNLDLTFLT